MDVPRHALIVALLVLFTIVACSKTKSIAPDPSDRPMKDAVPPDDEVEVWSMVVDDVAAPYVNAGATMPVVEKTSKPMCLFDLSASIPTAKAETLDTYLHATAQETLRPLHARIATRLVADDVSLPQSPPPGFVALSAVAFDGAHRDALVCAMHVLGPSSMRAVVYHLVRDGDAWRKMEVARCL